MQVPFVESEGDRDDISLDLSTFYHSTASALAAQLNDEYGNERNVHFLCEMAKMFRLAGDEALAARAECQIQCEGIMHQLILNGTDAIPDDVLVGAVSSCVQTGAFDFASILLDVVTKSSVFDNSSHITATLQRCKQLCAVGSQTENSWIGYTMVSNYQFDCLLTWCVAAVGAMLRTTEKSG